MRFESYYWGVDKIENGLFELYCNYNSPRFVLPTKQNKNKTKTKQKQNKNKLKYPDSAKKPKKKNPDP